MAEIKSVPDKATDQSATTRYAGAYEAVRKMESNRETLGMGARDAMRSSRQTKRTARRD